MSRMTTIDDDRALCSFAECAAAAMAKDTNIATYSDGNPTSGGFLAIRWGLGNDCVLVVRLDDDFEPVNFQQAIRRTA